jgi:hypothetical protein
MGPKLAARLTALTVLVVGLLAAPAAAQDSLEEECLVALQAQLQPFTSDQLQALDAFFDEPGNVSLEAFLRDLLDDPTLSLEGLDPELCTIYIPNVFVDDGTVDDGVAVDDGIAVDDGVAADDGERTSPRVLGTTQRRALPFTGFDVLWLTAFGLAIVGLGYVAVRRSRDQAP